MDKLNNLFVVVKRYDDRYLGQYGFHFYYLDGDSYRYEEVPFLLNAEQAEYKVKDFTEHEGYTEIDLDWNNIPEWLERQISLACPIEFHKGLRDRDESITSRIRAFGKIPTERQKYAQQILEILEDFEKTQQVFREKMEDSERLLVDMREKGMDKTAPEQFEALEAIVQRGFLSQAEGDTQLLILRDRLKRASQS